MAYCSPVSVPSSAGTPANTTLPPTGRSVVLSPVGMSAKLPIPTVTASWPKNLSGPVGPGGGGDGVMVTEWSRVVVMGMSTSVVIVSGETATPRTTPMAYAMKSGGVTLRFSMPAIA